MNLRSVLSLTLCLGTFAWMRPAHAVDGFFSTVGIARGAQPGDDCSVPLGPDDSELFAFETDFNELNTEDATRREYCIDGIVSRGVLDWDQSSGAYQIVDMYFPAITITHYPDPALVPLTEHRGMVLQDIEDGFGWADSNVAQEIPAPLVRPRPGSNELSWPPLPTAGAGGACQLAGSIRHFFFFVGWNVYRLQPAIVPPGISTPDHYLCGPDLDCTTIADNGFVAYVANAPSTADGLLHFSDTQVPADPTGAEYVYVVQPVKDKGSIVLQDADGDTIQDFDLNGDGIPEFVDPSGRGLGLTGRIGMGAMMAKPILISTDSQSISDALIRVWKRTGFYDVTWDANGPGLSPIGHDLHGGFLSDLRIPASVPARRRLGCDLPDGPSSVALSDPDFNAGNRYYLMSVAYSSSGSIVEEYGADSFGVEHPATTTLPACR